MVTFVQVLLERYFIPKTDLRLLFYSHNSFDMLKIYKYIHFTFSSTYVCIFITQRDNFVLKKYSLHMQKYNSNVEGYNLKASINYERMS